MQDIIPAIDRDLLRSELTEERFLRNTSKLNNQLYLVNHHNAPNVTREIGRLRELAFRTAGGGTGKSIDLDSYDTSDHPFEQLVLWDPEDQEIIAGYRLIKCVVSARLENGKIDSPTAKLFDLSDLFYEKYIPHTVELGRSFVQPKYQRGASRKGLFSMDNLWDGLGAVLRLNPDLKYMFGKVTMYPSYDREARNLLLSFLQYFFPDQEELARPKELYVTPEELDSFHQRWAGKTLKEAYPELKKEIRARGENIPPLINTYMDISPSMKTFGTAFNESFGAVEETGILVTIDDIYENRRERYLDSFDEHREFRGPRG